MQWSLSISNATNYRLDCATQHYMVNQDHTGTPAPDRAQFTSPEPQPCTNPKSVALLTPALAPAVDLGANAAKFLRFNKAPEDEQRGHSSHQRNSMCAQLHARHPPLTPRISLLNLCTASSKARLSLPAVFDDDDEVLLAGPPAL